MEENKKFYITTPIYYPSGKWHLGTCYTTVVCDALARFKRMQGYDTFYLTGTDEHGQKIEENAQAAGITPKEFVDVRVNSLIEIWKLLDISYDKFIRTTDKEHEQSIARMFEKLYNQGDIYKGEYEGLYCVPCESYWTSSQLLDGKCPDCGREVRATKEESYFFKMTKYRDRLIDLIKNDHEFLQPQTRKNEMLNLLESDNFCDLAVSRSSFKWGVTVPFDENHVIYVWIDALPNYITALGYLSDDDSLFKRYWPCDVHMMGKEIVRFHSIIWPALLMALGLDMPKKVYGHGWLLLGDGKLSKSTGNIVDPVVLSDRYSTDAVRYYLLRELPFGTDGTYTNERFLTRINTDLANALGNLVSRTTAMITQYFGGELRGPNVTEDIDNDLIENASTMMDDVITSMDKLNAPDALSRIWDLLHRANKYIDETKPWILGKDEKLMPRLQTVLYNLYECIRFAGVALTPFLTVTAPKIFEKLGLIGSEYITFESIAKFGTVPSGFKVIKGEPLFPRYDIAKELKEMSDYILNSEKVEQKEDKANTVDLISYDDFMNIKLKVAKVLTAEKVAKADKLLKLTLDVAGVARTVVAGIAKYYTADEMIGKSVVIVSNLQPVKLRGIMSEGMILCASDDKDNLVLVTPEKPMPSGSEVR